VEGGIYYAAQKRSAVTAEAKESTASIGLLYESKWRNEDSARSFLRVYADELPRKYSTLARRSKDEADEDEQVYSTNEGDVLLTISGTGVFVSEGFPLELARKLRDSVVSVQSDGPLELAGLKAQDKVFSFFRETFFCRTAGPGTVAGADDVVGGSDEGSDGPRRVARRDDILLFGKSEVVDRPGSEELTGLARRGAAGRGV